MPASIQDGVEPPILEMEMEKKVFLLPNRQFSTNFRNSFCSNLLYLWSYIHADFDFYKFKMAATNVFLDFCQL
jgi:hypothetical protein